jgi:hypothetical protein
VKALEKINLDNRVGIEARRGTQVLSGEAIKFRLRGQDDLRAVIRHSILTKAATGSLAEIETFLLHYAVVATRSSLSAGLLKCYSVSVLANTTLLHVSSDMTATLSDGLRFEIETEIMLVGSKSAICCGSVGFI